MFALQLVITAELIDNNESNLKPIKPLPVHCLEFQWHGMDGLPRPRWVMGFAEILCVLGREWGGVHMTAVECLCISDFRG